ncbi:MAG: class I SAM-dependent methyltransferase [Candidatus Omnitrophota bacterium]
MKSKKWSESGFFSMADKSYNHNQQLILSKLEKNPNAKLLDIGCNNGNFTLKAAEAIGTDKISGMEIDKKMAEEARKKNINVKICDANKKFPFSDNSFDVIVSNQVVEHILETDNFFSEIERILKPGGYAIISTQNFASLHNTAMLALGMQPISLHVSKVQVGNILRGVETSGHIKIFTIPALKDLAKNNGFVVEKTFAAGFYPFPHFVSKHLSKILKRYSVFIGVKIRK